MKDEGWFLPMLERLEKESLDDDTMAGPMLRYKKALPILEQIYTQGRADQNEADLEAVIMCTNWSDVAEAIEAAGPEVEE